MSLDWQVLARLDSQIPTSGPVWVQALGWARALEQYKPDALERVLELVAAEDTREVGLWALVWAGSSLDPERLKRAKEQLLAYACELPLWKSAVGEVVGHQRRVEENDVDPAELLAQGEKLSSKSKVKVVSPWLRRVAKVPADDFGAFLERLMLVRAHTSRAVCDLVDLALRPHCRNPGALRTQIAASLIDAHPTHRFLVEMADRGERIAIDAVMGLVSPFRAAWYRGDIEGMHASCTGTLSERVALINEAHGMWGQACPPQVWADGLMAFVHDDDALVRVIAVDTLAKLGNLEVRLDEAIEVAAEMLADKTRIKPTGGGTWQSDTHGFSAAKMMGYALGSENGLETCGALLAKGLAAGKKFTRENAGFAIGLGHVRAGRADELTAALREHAKNTTNIVNGAMWTWTGGAIRTKQQLNLEEVLVCIRDAGLEPTAFSVIRHRLRYQRGMCYEVALPRTPEGFAPLLCDLGTSSRSGALSILLRCARAGIPLGPVSAIVAGLFFDGDYRSGFPTFEVQVTSVLAAAAVNEDLGVTVPWLAMIENSSSPAVAMAAWVIASSITSSPIAENVGVDTDEAELLAKVAEVQSDFRSARHAADALYLLAKNGDRS